MHQQEWKCNEYKSARSGVKREHEVAQMEIEVDEALD